MSARTPVAIPTLLPCPSWCVKPAGHPFTDSGCPDVDRRHLAAYTELSTPEVAGWAVVKVFMMETVTIDDDGSQVDCTDVEIDLNLRANELTGSDARQLAAALLDAADVWDRVT